MPLSPRRFATLVVAILVTGAPARADDRTVRANERDACASSSERAQSLRAEGRLRATQLELRSCSRPSCPSIVRHDCEEWLIEVSKSVPTIVFGARDGVGRDLTDVRVLADGVLAAPRLDGLEVAIDPGSHVFRFESNGKLAHEETLLVREGEKQRLVTVRLDPAPASASASEPALARTYLPLSNDASRAPATASVSAATAVSLAPAARERRGLSTSGVVAGGIAVVALGTFGVLAADGQTRFDRCGERGGCTPDDVRGLERERVVAVSALGVGLLAAGASLWLLFARR